MSPDGDGTPQATTPDLPKDPAALQAAIDERRAHLAATVEELTTRLDPARLVQDAQHEAGERARGLVVDENGGLRVERVAAVAAAAAVLLVVAVATGARRRHRRSYRKAEKAAVDEAVKAAAAEARQAFRAQVRAERRAARETARAEAR